MEQLQDSCHSKKPNISYLAPSMKKAWFNFEIKVALLVFIIFVLVAITGIWTYQRYSNIVNGITAASRPDLRLVTAHALENDLTVLESHAKTFSLTSDTVYLTQFYATAENVEERLSELEKMNRKANRNIDIERLDTLISQKVSVLNELLFTQDQFRVQEALSKVVVKIDENAMKSSAMRNDEEAQDSRRKLLDWFKRKKKKEEEESAKAQKEDDSDLVQVETVNKEISKVRSEEVSIENRLKESELLLITEDQKLTMKIQALLDEFESSENDRIAAASRHAKYEADATNTQIAVFCIMAAGLLLFMAVIILQYSQNNKAYQIALKRSQSEAENLAKTRERFLANMSHEIRTPMNAISGFAEQLSGSDLNEVQSDYVNMIRKSATHLTYLINDVLDFSKLQSGKLKLEKSTFSIRELTSDVVSFVQQLAGEKTVAVQAEIDNRVPEFLVGDPYRLRQILLNLMSNSVKFTENGQVTLEVKYVEERAFHKVGISFVVSDTGIGMNAEELERVFADFEQASASTAKNYGGTGLGLPITKMLVELQGGNVSIDSEKGVGTRVIIDLSYGVGTESAGETVRDETDELPVRAVLVVDDEAYNRKLVRSILSKYHVEPMEAENGQEALEALNTGNVELVLLDARMPVMDGREVLRKMRKGAHKDVKVIVLTAAVSAKDRSDFEEDGADGFVSKPFSSTELLREINRVYDREARTKVESTTEPSSRKVQFEHLRSLSGNDMAFYTDMLQTFIQSTTGSFATLKVAFDNDDWEMVANEAHKISSPCKHIGANDLYQLLKRIENVTRARKTTKFLKNAVKELELEVDIVVKEVKKELNSI